MAPSAMDTNQIYDPCVKSEWAGGEKEEWGVAGESDAEDGDGQPCLVCCRNIVGGRRERGSSGKREKVEEATL